MIPYHLIADDKEVARVVLQGERLPRPDNCSQQLYAIMQDCWKTSSRDRPSMLELQTALQEVFTEETLEAAKTECVVCLTAEPVMALMPGLRAFGCRARKGWFSGHLGERPPTVCVVGAWAVRGVRTLSGKPNPSPSFLALRPQSVHGARARVL